MSIEELWHLVEKCSLTERSCTTYTANGSLIILKKKIEKSPSLPRPAPTPPEQTDNAFTHRETLRLRNLVLVVREHKVDAPRMYVDRVTQEAPRHCAALDVPARAPLAQRGFPENFSVFGFVRLAHGILSGGGVQHRA